jgi:hypothetical protein
MSNIRVETPVYSAPDCFFFVSSLLVRILHPRSALKPRVRPGSSPAPAPAAAAAAATTPATVDKDGQPTLLLTNESASTASAAASGAEGNGNAGDEADVQISTATHVAPWSLAEIAAEVRWCQQWQNHERRMLYQSYSDRAREF